MFNSSRDGWKIHFQKNVHMYCHRLVVEKSGREFVVQCEDTPGGYVGIWPYNLELESTLHDELVHALVDWAKSTGFIYRLYTSRDEYVTNLGRPNHETEGSASH
jgi:hypothetical protein